MPKPAAKSKSKTTTNRTGIAKKPSVEIPTANGPRRLPLPKRVWYNPQTWWRNLPAPERNPLPKATTLTKASTQLLVKEWKLFGGIALIYGLLTILLVRGLSSGNLGSYKSSLNGIFSGVGGKAESTLVSFSYLVLTSGGGNGTNAGVYQTLLLIIISLAIIWVLRQTLAGHSVRIRDSFYRGMYPIIPFFLVLLVIGLQLLPAAIGSYLYSTVVSGGIANDIIEKLLFGVLFGSLVVWSLRMITGSLFALYIVTLPDMTPIKALRSAKQLVYKRRLLIWRKLILLPVVLLVVAALLEVPLILTWTALASWVFFGFSMVSIAFLHTYMYKLYRELL